MLVRPPPLPAQLDWLKYCFNGIYFVGKFYSREQWLVPGSLPCHEGKWAGATYSVCHARIHQVVVLVQVVTFHLHTK
jgi:hypothetical protein